jgi:hypothetical protein
MKKDMTKVRANNEENDDADCTVIHLALTDRARYRLGWFEIIDYRTSRPDVWLGLEIEVVSQYGDDVNDRKEH